MTGVALVAVNLAAMIASTATVTHFFTSSFTN